MDLKYFFIFLLLVETQCDPDLKRFKVFEPKFEGDWIDTSDMFDMEEVLAKLEEEKVKENTEIPKEETAKSNTEIPKEKTAKENTEIPKKECQCPVCASVPVPDTEHCQMLDFLLSQIIGKVDMRNPDNSINLELKFTSHEITIIKNFIKSDCYYNDDAANALLHILSRLEFTTSKRFEDYVDILMNSVSQHRHYFIALIIPLICFLCLVWMWHYSRSWYEVLFRCFLLLFIVSCFWTWMQMYQVKLAEKEAARAVYEKNIPPECRLYELTIFESLQVWFKDTFSLRRNPCIESHKYIVVDPVWEVNPLVCVTETVTRVVLHPVGIVAEKIGLFFRNLFIDIPVQHWPLVIGIVCFFGFFILLMHFRYRIRHPLFGAIEPTSAPTNTERPVLAATSPREIRMVQDQNLCEICRNPQSNLPEISFQANERPRLVKPEEFNTHQEVIVTQKEKTYSSCETIKVEEKEKEKNNKSNHEEIMIKASFATEIIQAESQYKPENIDNQKLVSEE